jgi:6-pyruvoyltetrahydropterin/6-carboxytetrahydropterin synthase
MAMETQGVRMARTVAFSSGHRYWRADWSANQNRAAFGRWASPYNHGHNYVLHVEVKGPVDPVTGMVVNIKRVDDVLKERVVSRFDQRSINDEVPGFDGRSASLENLLLCLAKELGSPGVLPPPCRLTELNLEESPLLSGRLDLEKSRMTLTRVYEFAASHRLHSPQLSDQDNVKLYGKCNHVHGHGHNYVLEVTVAGEPNPDTGMMVDLEALDQAVHQRVVDRYDHRNLDVDLPELAGQVTTSENVALAIFRELKPHLPAKLDRIRLYETARNAFEVRSEDQP